MEKEYKLLDVWKAPHIPENVKELDRQELIRKHCMLSDKPFPSELCTPPMPMLWWEELIACCVMFVFFASLLYGPFIFLFLLFYSLKIAFAFAAIAVTIAYIPTRFDKHACFSYVSTLILRYFSYRGSWTTFMPTNTAFILAGPPHGLFPIGNICAMLALPRFAGLYIRGAAASAVVNFPVAGNMLRLIGIIDASKSVVQKHLLAGDVVGISTGGIAEIFETDHEVGKNGRGKETIILKSRGGMCKLALQTGTPIVPSYLFGNSTAFSVWFDSMGIMQWLSRKLRVSLVLFYGRWGLPIPYRTTIFGVCGAPINVPKKESPTKEEIQSLLDNVQVQIKTIFDVYKKSYGWSDVELVIK